jgi:hypothetical protein
MSVLIARIEQAFVGALLADGFPWATHELRVRTIGAEELTDSVRRQVLTSAIALHQGHYPPIPGRTLVDAVAAETAVLGVTRGDVLRLRWSCPDPDHVADYARLLAVARFRRHVAANAAYVAAQAAAGPHWEHPDHLGGLAAALRSAARLHPDLLPAPDGQDIPGPTPGPPRAPHPDPRTAREESVLSGVLQGGPDVRLIAALLPPETFRAGMRRRIYEAIVALAHAGSSVDSVLVAWELAERRAAVRDGGTQDPRCSGSAMADHPLWPGEEADTGIADAGTPASDARRSRAETDLAYLDHLPAARPAGAVEDARQLLTDDVAAGRYRTASGTDTGLRPTGMPTPQTAVHNASRWRRALEPTAPPTPDSAALRH